MKVAGQAVLHATPQAAWDALLDPAVLVRTIPGCERLETTGENAYAMTVNAGVASIKGTYAGTVELRDLDEPRSLIMRAAGAGAPGTIDTSVAVRFTEDGEAGTTQVSYDADAVVGGMLGGVGQRMLTSVSKRMAAEFFGAVDSVLTGTEAAAAPAAASVAEVGSAAPQPSGAGTVYTAPSRPASGRDEFVKGIAVGAGLVLLGVIAGAVASRRRR
ncbi:MAG TPA: carbon monoxide dehydrogenase subunit G [Nocardioidaceae bacterium]|nr:carbon monoxide dehydrogenase subunit G [Nocardioidaceae bacterium]